MSREDGKAECGESVERNGLQIGPTAIRTYMSDENDDLDPFLAVANIAAPVVAAELLRIADAWAVALMSLDRGARGELVRCVRELRGRANELAPDGEL